MSKKSGFHCQFGQKVLPTFMESHHSDLEEEAGPATFFVNIITSMASSIPGTQLSEISFDSLFP